LKSTQKSRLTLPTKPGAPDKLGQVSGQLRKRKFTDAKGLDNKNAANLRSSVAPAGLRGRGKADQRNCKPGTIGDFKYLIYAQDRFRPRLEFPAAAQRKPVAQAATGCYARRFEAKRESLAYSCDSVR
jgi:hypothetical protein